MPTPLNELRLRGAVVLSDEELLTLLCGPAPGASWEAHLQPLGGLAELRSRVLEELCEQGLGVGAAARLLAAVELGRRALSRPLFRGAPLTSPRRVLTYLRGLAGLEEEEMHVVGLDRQRRAMAHFVAGKGSANSVYVCAGDVFRRLVKMGAAAAVVVHNHPSGDPTPSPADLALTSRLVDAGELLGIPLIDHIVVARSAARSLLDLAREEADELGELEDEY